MKKYKLELTANELRALNHLVYENPCSAGCCYEEMEGKNSNCDKCKFQKAKYELIDKIEALGDKDE